MILSTLFTILPPTLAPILAVMNIWHALPLIVSVSLVCAATRHEEFGPIMQHAMRFGLWIVVFMAVVMGGLTLVGMLG